MGLFAARVERATLTGLLIYVACFRTLLLRVRGFFFFFFLFSAVHPIKEQAVKYYDKLKVA